MIGGRERWRLLSGSNDVNEKGETFTPETEVKAGAGKVVPRGLEPRTLRLLAVRSNQLSYETK